MQIKPISSKQAMAMVMENHYSQRHVGCRHSFGLFVLGELSGCVCYSIPASYTLCKGVCGPDFKPHVLELSRLVVTTYRKNAASFLIGNSLKLLGNSVVVSYADGNDHVGHVGYVYQATNWIYTGRGNAEPKWINPLDGSVVSFTRRHIDRKAEALGLDWKQLIKEPQQGKHRYVVFTGDKRFKKRADKALRYPRKQYPKGETRRHEIEKPKIKQGELF